MQHADINICLKEDPKGIVYLQHEDSHSFTQLVHVFRISQMIAEMGSSSVKQMNSVSLEIENVMTMMIAMMEVMRENVSGNSVLMLHDLHSLHIFSVIKPCFFVTFTPPLL